MKKVNAVFEENARYLSRMASCGQPYAVLITQDGHETLPQTFPTKDLADNVLTEQTSKGINGAVVKTHRAAPGRDIKTNYTAYIRPQSGFGSFDYN